MSNSVTGRQPPEEITIHFDRLPHFSQSLEMYTDRLQSITITEHGYEKALQFFREVVEALEAKVSHE